MTLRSGGAGRTRQSAGERLTLQWLCVATALALAALCAWGWLDTTVKLAEAGKQMAELRQMQLSTLSKLKGLEQSLDRLEARRTP